MRSLVLIILSIGAFTLFTGCYTQLAVVDTSPPPEESVEWVVDSATGDTVKVIREVDTIETDDGRTCIWERDLMGYPRLRCYDSFYPRDWYYYNYSPWWYRNDPYWYDYRRCPRYYYYDRSCGCCRYTTSSYHYHRYHNEDGDVTERGEPSPASGSSFRSRGVPDRGTSHKNSSSGTSTRSSVTGSSKASTPDEITVTNEKTKSRTVIRKRSRGVPESRAKPSSKKKKSKTSATQSSSPPPAPAPSNTKASPSSGSHSSPPPPPPQNSGDDRPNRRRSRSW